MKITFKIYADPTFYVRMAIPYSINNLRNITKLTNVRNVRVTKNA